MKELKEMSLKELLALYLEKILCNNITRAKEVELKILTLFSTLEEKVKELEETYNTVVEQRNMEEKKVEELWKENTALKKQVEGLKCCGNCKLLGGKDCPEKLFNYHSYFPCWQSDSMTKENRNG